MLKLAGSASRQRCRSVTVGTLPNKARQRASDYAVLQLICLRHTYTTVKQIDGFPAPSPGSGEFLLVMPMCLGVALRTQGDEILFRVVTAMAAKPQVVDLEVLHAATDLTAPSVPPQDLLMQFAIVHLAQLDPGRFR